MRNKSTISLHSSMRQSLIEIIVSLLPISLTSEVYLNKKFKEYKVQHKGEPKLKHLIQPVVNQSDALHMRTLVL